jgi:DNA primase catalytic subunit
MRFSFPDELSPPTVEERQLFYTKEFNFQHVRNLYYRWKKPVFAVDIGSETTRYRPKYKKYLDKLVFIREYDDLKHLKSKLISYAPEDLYYDIRTYDRDPRQTNAIWEKPSGQQLVFDLDPELMSCRRCELTKQNMDDEKRASFTFCEDCYEATAKGTLQLWQFLERHFEYLNTYFSGRGFHIQVRDDEAFTMEDEDRERLAAKVSKKFPVDEKVTAGEKELMRMPGSLHGLTGRKVVSVTKEDLSKPLEILYEKSQPEVLE